MIGTRNWDSDLRTRIPTGPDIGSGAEALAPVVGTAEAVGDTTYGMQGGFPYARQSRSRRKDILISRLAVELRSPLSAMLAAVEVVRLASGTDAGVKAADAMRRQIDHITGLIKDVVDATRWANGKITVQKCRLDVRDVVNDAAKDLAMTADERGHELIVAKATQPMWIDGDHRRLLQALSTLLRDAVIRTEPGGRVSLHMQATASAIILHISDTGEGIEAEASRHDLCSQGNSYEGPGLGIGLSVAREIVSLHDGRIDAGSLGAGEGREFTVTLPIIATTRCDLFE